MADRGDGGDGRIRFEATEGRIQIEGTVTPEPTTGQLSVEPEPAGGRQRPGDFNQDGKLNVADATALLRFLFADSTTPLPCGGNAVSEGGNLTLLDVNGDEGVNIADAVYTLTYLFLGGEPPVRGIECVSMVGCPDVCGP